MTILDGQRVMYNPGSKIAAMYIDKPFMSAGKKLGWKWRPQAVGLNPKIVDFVLKHHYKFIVNIGSYNKSFFITDDQLQDYLKYNECNYKVRDQVLKIIPIELLTPFSEHKEEQ